MPPNFKNVLILYKKSAYEIYFLGKRSTFFRKGISFSRKEMNAFRQTHIRHYATLHKVEKLLSERDIKYKKFSRGQKVNFASLDWVVTVGEDGTFLEAARVLKQQIIIGINSDPRKSVGQFCIAHDEDLEGILEKIFRGKFTIELLHRIKLNKRDLPAPINVLNDLLICHQNPAAMSRYHLTINGIGEEQRSSGIWIATAAGSTGAIYSAGGKILPPTSNKYQYEPRELYFGFRKLYQLKGGILSHQQTIKIKSLMRSGMIFVDGAHFKIPFEFGQKIIISHSSEPLKMAKVS